MQMVNWDDLLNFPLDPDPNHSGSAEEGHENMEKMQEYREVSVSVCVCVCG